MGVLTTFYVVLKTAIEVLTTLTVVLNIDDGNMLFASYLGTKRPHGHLLAEHVHVWFAVEIFSLVTQVLSSLAAYPSRELPHHGGDQQCTFKVSADWSFSHLSQPRGEQHLGVHLRKRRK